MTEKKDNRGLMFGGGAGLLAVVATIGGQSEQLGRLADILHSTGGRVLLGVLFASAIGGFMYQQIVIPLRGDNEELKKTLDETRTKLETERDQIRKNYEAQMEAMRAEFTSRIESLNKQILQLTKDLAATNATLEAMTGATIHRPNRREAGS